MKRIVKRCPKCKATHFLVTAHVTQDWEVDENGNVLNISADCTEVTHEPNDDDVWTCAECGYDAAGSEFNCAIADKTQSDLLTFMLLDMYKEKGEKEVAEYAENYGCSSDVVKDIIKQIKNARPDVRA